ncbi:hypothetical protein HOY80DRAFT_1059905 [Tuber brumale]|nr:hypothetical protein HOY80DRAFT_1059905 [Tuber brumale]
MENELEKVENKRENQMERVENKMENRWGKVDVKIDKGFEKIMDQIKKCDETRNTQFANLHAVHQRTDAMLLLLVIYVKLGYDWYMDPKERA